MESVSLQDFLKSLGLLTWATVMLVLIIVIVSKATSITTTNLLLVMILSTMAFKIMTENANDVTNAVADAIRTFMIKPKED